MSLINKSDEVATVTTPHLYNDFEKSGKWVVARYFNGLALSPINGECRCVDAETGQLKAKIEIRMRTDYVCDIASKIFRNRMLPITGPWCSVVLHPGSTLTIKFPIQAISSASTDDTPRTSFSQLPYIYDYETKFWPKDLIKLRQLVASYDVDIYDEILYGNAIAGDALALDVSQMARGEVTLKYHLDEPLALRSGLNSFYSHWTLISRNDYVPDNISAVVKVSLAFTHQYGILGCDRRRPSVFDVGLSKNFCLPKSMGFGIGDLYECSYDIMRDVRKVGIRCGSNE
ncbi:Outer capsid glycoprotein VP7 [Babesia bigemina]|uniref:Outer capsid glycoprotein VP7 n=1 Tax=Babesia bigemina TaxID=5866 RepID=A0A061D4C3_BABBI|nr:Outer capsid glycoprotein VP7 [Babesia bigemina]XP_012767614.1 Outer capsid glycoprotein VP7 [Babesia bigemina]CDR95424.1 Outer capsid glycoprotein VP7 [Babesia bigemina]CDR95428.1 Outer capsid glycoprotein VP7 [Babesia bigemina]|eukprot:XP_012767610.1 Outer capsid glycoprotein VP7 [Babesia bigemina]